MNTPEVIELNNQRLLTTDQLAEFYGTTPTRIKQNFGYNKDKFVEGEHYYFLEGEDLREFKNRVGNSYSVGKQARSLLLYTKRGASRHSKMLGTDQAWDMYDQLEESYFNVRPAIELPMDPRSQLKLMFEFSEQTAERVDDIDIRLTEIEENKLITTEDKSTLDRAVRRKVAQICKEQHLDQSAKSMLFADLGSSIKQLFNVPNRGRIKDKEFLSALDFVHHWEPSSVTKARIQQTRLDLEESE